MKAEGRVFKFGDNVDTDVIIPARYLNSSNPAELATHCMEDIDKDFVKNVKKGDIIVANKNFGCGSSREHAPIAIKAAGVSCVIAETFARIFYRNSINIGLPIIECKEAAEAINAGDDVAIDFDSGIITDKTTGQTFQGQAFPEFMQKIIKAEGLVNYINNKNSYATMFPARRAAAVRSMARCPSASSGPGMRGSPSGAEASQTFVPQTGQALGWAWKRRSRGSLYSAAQFGHSGKQLMDVVARS